MIEFTINQLGTFIVDDATLNLSFLWLFLGVIGLDVALVLYRRPYYDKVVHFFGGVALTSFLVLNGYVDPVQVLIINGVAGFIFEIGQLLLKDTFRLQDVGFPDGFRDIIWHLLGAAAFMFEAGLI